MRITENKRLQEKGTLNYQMKKAFKADDLLVSLGIIILLLGSCNTRKEIPFPENKTGFSEPKTEPFEFPAPQPYAWTIISPDSTPRPTHSTFNLNTLPSRPFVLNDFKSIGSPLRPNHFDETTLEEIPISMDSIAGESVSVKTILLPQPVISRASPPAQLRGITTGILSLSTESGLPGDDVTAGIVDEYGLVWLGTSGGELVRYTGEYFHTYSFLNLINGGQDNISTMTTNGQGNLWMATAAGDLYSLDLAADILYKYEITERVFELRFDRNGTLWLAAGEAGLYALDTDRKKIKKIVGKEKWNEGRDANSFAICIDRQNNVWFGNDLHVSVLNAKRNTIRRIGKNEGLNVSFVSALYEDRQGEIWVGAHENINVISLANQTVTKVGVEDGFPPGAHLFGEDRIGRLWLIDHEVVCIFDRGNGLIRKIRLSQNIFTFDQDRPILNDFEGNVWIGTLSNGALIIDPFGPLPEHLDKNTGLSDNDVWGMKEDKNGLMWISTHNGINIYDDERNLMRVLDSRNGLPFEEVESLSILDEDRLLATSYGEFAIINIARYSITGFKIDEQIARSFSKGVLDDQGNLWLGSSNGLFQLNQNRGILRKVVQTSGINVWNVVQDDERRLWLGTETGVHILDAEKNSMVSLSAVDKLNSARGSLSALYRSATGSMWVGGDYGISIINPKEGTMTHLTRKHGLEPETVFDMLESNGRMYVGSINGMIVIEPPDSTGSTNRPGWNFYNYGKRDGFPFNDYNQLSATRRSNGQTWWGVTPMLTIHTQEPTIDQSRARVFITGVNIMDHKPSFNNRAQVLMKLQASDTVWDHTLNNFYTAQFSPKDSGYLSGHKIRWDSIGPIFKLPQGLEVPHDQNSFNFSFSNSNARSRDKIVYSYILEGADHEWSDLSSTPNSRNYYNLRPGRYTFKVVSCGFNHIWSEPATITFTIRPPWWQTWWAYLLFLSGFVALVSAIVHYRSRWLQRENRILEERVSHRTEQLKKSIEELKTTQNQLIQSEKMASLGELTAGIAHEIQNPLNFVNNFSEVNAELASELVDAATKGNLEEVQALARNIKENEEKISNHGKRADGIVRSMLQHSRTNVGQKELTDINALCDEYLRLAYHGFRAKDKGFSATFETDFDPELPRINVVPQDIGRVLLNLINNAFYAVNEKGRSRPEGYKPKVLVATKKVSDRVEITVRDNGNGIPDSIKEKIFQPFFTTKPTGQGTGLGLSLSYDIVKANGGELSVKTTFGKVETTEGKGSEFIVSLPVRSVPEIS